MIKLRIALLILVSILIINTLFSEETTFLALATALSPLKITKLSDLNFGRIIVPQQAGKVIIYRTSNSRTSDPWIEFEDKIFSRAIFLVNGTAGRRVNITLSSKEIYLYKKDFGSQNSSMRVTLDAPTRVTIRTDGSAYIYIGGTLYISANQEVGEYEGEVIVSINY